jgi:threonine dehydrogenase-like Zn-dependent dehydrogenase
MEIVLDWMARGTVHLEALVTHRLPLIAYPRAFATVMGKRETAAFKVAFDLSEGRT